MDCSVPQIQVWFLANLLAMLLVHAPEAEAVHDLSQCIIVVEEFNRSHNVENDFRVLAHEKSVDRAWNLDNVVAWRATPLVPTILKSVHYLPLVDLQLTRDSPSCP